MNNKQLDEQADEIMSGMFFKSIYLYAKRKLKEDLENGNIKFAEVNELSMEDLDEFMSKESDKSEKEIKKEEEKFLKIVRNILRQHPNNPAFSQYKIMFCEFYLHSKLNNRLKLFKYFPELVSEIVVGTTIADKF